MMKLIPEINEDTIRAESLKHSDTSETTYENPQSVVSTDTSFIILDPGSEKEDSSSSSYGSGSTISPSKNDDNSDSATVKSSSSTSLRTAAKKSLSNDNLSKSISSSSEISNATNKLSRKSSKIGKLFRHSDDSTPPSTTGSASSSRKTSPKLNAVQDNSSSSSIDLSSIGSQTSLDNPENRTINRQRRAHTFSIHRHKRDNVATSDLAATLQNSRKPNSSRPPVAGDTPSNIQFSFDNKLNTPQNAAAHIFRSSTDINLAVTGASTLGKPTTNTDTPRRTFSFHRFTHSSGTRSARNSLPGSLEMTSSSSTTSSRNIPSLKFSPNDYLPKYLESSNWSLSAKYSSGKLLSRHKVVGKGATAIVKTVQRNGDKLKTLYAAKVYNNLIPGENPIEYHHKLADEYLLARGLHHQNVVSTLDLCVDTNNCWCTVMEFCQCGDLFSLMEGYKAENKRMPREERNCLFKQMLLGVDYLHRNGVAHRDIKPENLMLTSNGVLKVSDFGVSVRLWPQDAEHGPDGQLPPITLSAGVSGSEPYISPEVFDWKITGKKYDARLVDVWSCAIVYINLTYNGGFFGKAVPEDAGYERFVGEVDRYWDQERRLENYIKNETQRIVKQDEVQKSERANSDSKTEDSLDSNSQDSDHSLVSTAASSSCSLASKVQEISIKDDQSAASDTNSRRSSAGASTISESVDDSSESLVAPKDVQQSDNILSRESYLDIPEHQQPLFFFNDYGTSGKRVMASMLNPDPNLRIQIADVLSSGYVRNIGMCITVDDPDQSPSLSRASSSVKIGDLNSIKKLKSQNVLKKHTHKPPSKIPSGFGLGNLKDPYK